MHCPFCQKDIPDNDKFTFRETCPKCLHDLHVCVVCKHYDRGTYNDCRESQAERVVDKERFNHCEYFIFANPGSVGQKLDPQAEAKRKLEELFKKK